MNFLFNLFGEWLRNWIKQELLNIAGFALDLTTIFGDSFWGNELVSIFIDFATWFNVLIGVICAIFVTLDVAEARGRVDWSSVFGNVFKAITFIAFARYIGLFSYYLANNITTALHFSLPDKGGLETLIQGAVTANANLDILMVIITAIAFVSFAVMCMLRCGTLFVLILTSGFYITDIMRGETTKLGEWLRQVIGNSTTYLVQYILFYMGLLYFSSSSLVACFICWATMFSVPKILLKYNMSTGTKGVFSSVGSAIGQGVSFAGKFVK